MPEPASGGCGGGYLAPAGEGAGEVRDRGSRFLAIARPVADEAAAKAALAELARRFPDATHCCWAWRLGSPSRERSSDAGEPAGTAGPPILQALRGAGLSDALVVVVRWFGGTKLGKGGLARAYAAAAKEALAGVPVVARVPTTTLAVELPYDRLGAVKRLIHPPEVELLSEAYGAAVRLTLAVHLDRREALARALADLGVFV